MCAHGELKRRINPLGYDCVNVRVQRAIAKVVKKAKSHYRSKKWNDANGLRVTRIPNGFTADKTSSADKRIENVGIKNNK